MVTLNAKISGTMLGCEDHGIMSAFVYLEMSGSGIGFGGYALDGPFDKQLKRRLPATSCGLFVARVLAVVGVTKWEDLKGKPVRIRMKDEFHGPVHSLGNFLKDEWFTPSEELK